MGLNGREPLFCTITKGENFGTGLDSSYVRRLLPRLARRAGIERRVHPHALRHSLASTLAHEGKLPLMHGRDGQLLGEVKVEGVNSSAAGPSAQRTRMLGTCCMYGRPGAAPNDFGSPFCSVRADLKPVEHYGFR